MEKFCGKQMTLSLEGAALYLAPPPASSFQDQGYFTCTLKVSQEIPYLAGGWFCKGGIICHSEHGSTNQDRLDYKCNKQLPNSP